MAHTNKDPIDLRIGGVDATPHFIVLTVNGAYYSNQTGGTMCAHPWARGYLVPDNRRDLRNAIHQLSGERGYILRDYWDRFDRLKHLCHNWFPGCRLATEEEIECALQYDLLGPVDANEEVVCFGEAWMPVVLEAPEDLPPYDRPTWWPLRGRLAILTWHNSD
jgi:hypothetical protein